MKPNFVTKLKLTRNNSNHHRHKLSAAILFQGKPLSFGFNDRFRTHPAVSKYNKLKTVHAEVSALFKVKDRSLLRKCTLVVYREDRWGQMALARPCPVCLSIIKDFGIKKIIFSDKDGWKTERI